VTLPLRAPSIQGAIRPRSMIQMRFFLAPGIETAEEFDVMPDPRSGEVRASLRATLAIKVTDPALQGGPPWVGFGGRYYVVEDGPWDRLSSMMLNVLCFSRRSEKSKT